MLPYTAFVIHDEQRIDRLCNINNLKQVTPNLKIYKAIKPIWEENLVARAVRGCSLSHIDIASTQLKPDAPVLVLEDDAAVHERGLLQWENIQHKIPADAGIVLLGSETEQVSDPNADGFMEVFPKCWGTHGVLYMPTLLKTNFFTKAAFAVAINKMGPAQHSAGMCYESVLFTSLQDTGLKMYRPPSMIFKTVESISSRTTRKMAARERSVDIEPTQGQ